MLNDTQKRENYRFALLVIRARTTNLVVVVFFKGTKKNTKFLTAIFFSRIIREWGVGVTKEIIKFQ